MAIITDPKTGLIVSAPYQSNQFDDAKKARRWLTFFASRVVDAVGPASLPASPVEGTTVVVAATDTTHPNAVARYSTELHAWEYVAPWNGLAVTDLSRIVWTFNGSSWAAPSSNSALPAWLANHPDAPTATQHADSCEFESLPSDWTQQDQVGSTWSAGSAALSIEGGGLKLATTTAQRARVHHYLRPATPINWRVVAKLSFGRQNVSYSNFGISLVDAAGSSCLFGVSEGGALGLYNPKPDTSPYTQIQLGLSAAYLRAIYNGATITFAYSLDGRVWFELPGFTEKIGQRINAVTRYGVGVSGNTSATPAIILGCDFFRVWAL